MRISDWSSDVCSSDLIAHVTGFVLAEHRSLAAEHAERVEWIADADLFLGVAIFAHAEPWRFFRNLDRSRRAALPSPFQARQHLCPVRIDDAVAAAVGEPAPLIPTDLLDTAPLVALAPPCAAVSPALANT